RVDIFGGFLVTGQDAAAEGNNASLLVADGEDEPAAKTVVIMIAVFLAQNEAGLLEEPGRMAFAFPPVNGIVPGFRGVAEAEEFDRFIGDAAFEEVVAGDLAARLVGESALPALGNLFVNLPERVLDVPNLLLAGLVVELERNPGPFCQAADGVKEGN